MVGFAARRYRVRSMVAMGSKADNICLFSPFDSAQAFDEPLLNHLLGVAAVSWPLPPDGKRGFA